MTMYRAKLIIERVETRRPIIRGAEVPKESVYDIVRIEVTADNQDVALSKIINLAKAEQTDRDARLMMPGNQNRLPVFDEQEEDEDSI